MKRKAHLPGVAACRWLNIQVNSVVQPWGVRAGRGCSQERRSLKERPAKKPPSKDKLPKLLPVAARNRYSYLHNKLIKYECWGKSITPLFISGYSKPKAGCSNVRALPGQMMEFQQTAILGDSSGLSFLQLICECPERDAGRAVCVPISFQSAVGTFSARAAFVPGC